MRVSGRPASLATWNQIKADVLGIPVLRIPGDATTSGVAMLAGLGVGIYADVAQAVTIACRPETPIEPDPANHDRYASIYEHYRAVVSSTTLHTGAGAVPPHAPPSRVHPGARP
jgi:sugar (pentulose or hexulose) kinase